MNLKDGLNKLVQKTNNAIKAKIYNKEKDGEVSRKKFKSDVGECLINRLYDFGYGGKGEPTKKYIDKINSNCGFYHDLIGWIIAGENGILHIHDRIVEYALASTILKTNHTFSLGLDKVCLLLDGAYESQVASNKDVSTHVNFKERFMRAFEEANQLHYIWTKDYDDLVFMLHDEVLNHFNVKMLVEDIFFDFVIYDRSDSFLEYFLKEVKSNPNLAVLGMSHCNTLEDICNVNADVLSKLDK